MMRRPKTILLIAGLILSCSTAAYSQQPSDTVRSLPGVEISTSVDRAEMYIGDLITYKLAITYDSTIKLIPSPLGSNLGAFDVKDYRADIETKLPGGRVKSETDFTLSTFTTGNYIIPPVPVLFLMPDSTRKIMLSESVPIKVLSLLENAGDSLDIQPLKAQYEFRRDMTRYYILGGIGLVLLIGLAVAWWYWRRHRPGQEELVDLRDPWEIAFEKLAHLKEKKYVEEGQYKPYYFELTELTREFLGRMYRVDVLEMTTDEFVQRFHEVELPAALYGDLTGFFKHADLVKFAKFWPERSRLEEDYLFVHDMIAQVRDDHERRRQTEVHINHTANQSEAVAAGGGV